MTKEKLSTDIRELCMVTGSQIFPLLPWFCLQPKQSQVLDKFCSGVSGLSLQDGVRKHPEKKAFNFGLPSAAHERVFLSSGKELGR